MSDIFSKITIYSLYRLVLKFNKKIEVEVLSIHQNEINSKKIICN